MHDSDGIVQKGYLERFATTFSLPHKKFFSPTQSELISDVIQIIQNEKIGIFEIPTLKEESIHLIYSICTWIKENSNGKNNGKRSHDKLDEEGNSISKYLNDENVKRNRLLDVNEEAEDDDFEKYSFESCTITSQSPEPTDMSTSEQGIEHKSGNPEIIVVQLNDFLNSDFRSSLNTKFPGAILVFEESYGLVDLIIKRHSVVIDDNDIQAAINDLEESFRRDPSVAQSANGYNLNALMGPLTKISQFFPPTNDTFPTPMSPLKFMEDVFEDIDEDLLQDLIMWLKDQAKQSTHKLALQSVYTFLEYLLNADFKGLIHYPDPTYYAKNSNSAKKVRKWSLKYQLLNPDIIFEKIFKAVRCILLLGQVMDSSSYLKVHLFPKHSPDLVVEKTYPLLVPGDNLITGIVEKSAAGEKVEYTHKKRTNEYVMHQLLEMIVEYSRVIPDGIVVFLTVYDYMNKLKEFWQKYPLYTTLKNEKDIFFEPSNLSDAENELQMYKEAIYSTGQKGAILFTVVNSEFSELIDFKDRLARAIIMVGMPFAYKKDIEFIERQEYNHENWKESKAENFLAKEQKQERKFDLNNHFYVDLCMNKVNKSIGRSICHQNDFSALILLDRRYTEIGNQSRLSKWIQMGGSITNWNDFNRSKKDLELFFANKKKTTRE
ncbi:hypothetical protein L7F22_043999 [Adiantum nelumboides]|nr:hypothetical protein [Adiantum nelumboides]